MSWLRKLFIGLILIVSCHAYADDSPPHPINTLEMAAKIGAHYFDYMHFRPIGVCLWWQCSWDGCSIDSTPELDEYLPDLIVTVYNEAGDDPWSEANETFDKVAHTSGSSLMRALTGNELSNGRDTATPDENNSGSMTTKSVDVIGSPMNLLHIPFAMLRPDTTSFVPYFQSALDSIPGRMGVAEALRLETYNPFGHFIGSGFTDHWAYEFPRSMTVDNNNDYKASVSIALHAADIVTNRHLLHVVNSTSNSCGEQCTVSNVIEENDDKHEIWQEIYPHDKHVILGKSDKTAITPIGQDDIKDGHGNYVFVVWRHYHGCVQTNENFLWKSASVPPIVKR